MILSTFTIHLANIEIGDLMLGRKARGIQETIITWMKIAPFDIPVIMFKTGTITVLFFTFRGGAVIYLLFLSVAHLALVKFACLLRVQSDQDGRTDMNQN